MSSHSHHAPRPPALLAGAALLATLAGALPVAAAPTAAAAAAAGPDRIAVALGRVGGGDGAGGLALVDASGRRIRTLTRARPNRADFQPAWSPDGARIAFVRWSGSGSGSYRIWVMRADGRGAHAITPAAAPSIDFSPAWSPDGRWIAYVRNSRLRIVRPDGTGGRTVPTGDPGGGVGFGIGWVSATRVAYPFHSEVPGDRPHLCQRVAGCGWVVTSRLDGSARRRVVPGRDAHWSPDGRSIVYTGPDGGVFTATASGVGRRMRGRGYRAEWSRDGRRIVYARMGDAPWLDAVWIMDRDGRHAHRILAGATDPAWRP